MTTQLIIPLLLILLTTLTGTKAQSTCSNYGLSFITGKTGFQSTAATDLWYARQDFTLEFWVKMMARAEEPQGVVQAFYVTGVTSCNIDGFGFYRYNATLYFVMGGTDVCDDNALVVDMDFGVWTHVAVVVGETQAELYVNGEVSESKTKGGDIRFDDAPFKVGLGPDPDSGFKDGELDEIRFWNTARTAAQIKNNYDVSLSVMDSSLLAYWRFEEGSDNNVVDSSNFNRQTIVTGTLDYIPNCMVASCLCGVEEYCVPDHDRTNANLECPDTKTSSTTKATSSTTKATSSSTTKSSSSTSMTKSSTAKVPETTTMTDDDSIISTETIQSGGITALVGSLFLLSFCLA